MSLFFNFISIFCLILGIGMSSVWALPSLAEMKNKFSNGPTYTDKEFETMALKLRQQAIESTRVPRVETQPSLFGQGFNRYPWKRNIFTTVFWIGERPTVHNPVPNNISSWDSHWYQHFGGYDNPNPLARHNFIPKTFIPKQNPFYCALPYNDITRGSTKADVKKMVPWFKDAFVKPGQSILKGRWIAIHYNGRTCFAQWEDCGPFRTDHIGYVFGNERPRPNLNRGAGLDISPATRDYLGLQEGAYCDWKFVDASAIPDGPWKNYGTNNTFWLLRQGKDLKIYDPNNARHGSIPVPSSSSASIKPSLTTTHFKNSLLGARVTPRLGE
ncbi:MAG: hypothetical protein ACH346_07225 [Chthoniobacterales bacterium]